MHTQKQIDVVEHLLHLVRILERPSDVDEADKRLNLFRGRPADDEIQQRRHPLPPGETDRADSSARERQIKRSNG